MVLQGCGTPPVNVDLSEPLPESLSAMHLFTVDDGTFEYNDRVVPYTLNTPLFSDYALKERAIYVPDGLRASYTERGVFEFPVGTVIIKSFLFPADLREPSVNLDVIETRLLVHYPDGWDVFPYIWNEDGTDAILDRNGEVRDVQFVDTTGETRSASYLIPQRNQCFECHEQKHDNGERYLSPIGPTARNLHRDYRFDHGIDNQLTHLASVGMLAGLPPLDDLSAATSFEAVLDAGVDALSGDTLNAAARDYLDTNCASCHNPNGVSGITSQLFLNYDNEDAFHLGVCKHPGSAGLGSGGREYDIVPGYPDESILLYRLETEEVGAMMPLLGRSLTHHDGAALIRAWIAAMPAETCEP